MAKFSFKAKYGYDVKESAVRMAEAASALAIKVEKMHVDRIRPGRETTNERQAWPHTVMA